MNLNLLRRAARVASTSRDGPFMLLFRDGPCVLSFRKEALPVSLAAMEQPKLLNLPLEPLPDADGLSSGHGQAGLGLIPATARQRRWQHAALQDYADSILVPRTDSSVYSTVRSAR